jgi:type III pantothenate kinase
MVEGLVARLRKELGFPCAVYATGGYASKIARHVQCIEHVDENLTLEGIRLVYERTRA